MFYLEKILPELGIIGHDLRVTGFMIGNKIRQCSKAVILVLGVIFPGFEIVVEQETAPDVSSRCHGHMVFPGAAAEDSRTRNRDLEIFQRDFPGFFIIRNQEIRKSS